MAMSTDLELPSYAEVANDTLVATSTGANDMDIATSPFKSEYSTGLQDKEGHAWLTLRVKSRSPNEKIVPFFTERDTISGVVELDATKIDSVHAVVIEVQGVIKPVGRGEDRFLSLKETLWDHGKAGAKLKDKHVWSFLFVLPKEVEVVGPHEKKGFYQLPPSFSEKASPALLDYRIVVTIKRGMLKANETLTTLFIYEPISAPTSSPIPLMQLARTEGTTLPSPKRAPEGWKVLPKIKLEGTLFGAKKVEVQCQLSIAKPMQYSIGSLISLHLVIESEDNQALDVLSSPTAICIELFRALTVGSESTSENPETRSNDSFYLPITRAYFWEGTGEPEDGPNRRVLHGEIDLKTKLSPTFVFPKLSVEYTVDLVGVEATGWVNKGQGRRPRESVLLSEPVKVTSRPLEGVVMRSNAPPGYKRPEKIDYTKSPGYYFYTMGKPY